MVDSLLLISYINIETKTWQRKNNNKTNKCQINVDKTIKIKCYNKLQLSFTYTRYNTRRLKSLYVEYCNSLIQRQVLYHELFHIKIPTSSSKQTMSTQTTLCHFLFSAISFIVYKYMHFDEVHIKVKSMNSSIERLWTLIMKMLKSSLVLKDCISGQSVISNEIFYHTVNVSVYFWSVSPINEEL